MKHKDDNPHSSGIENSFSTWSGKEEVMGLEKSVKIHKEGEIRAAAWRILAGAGQLGEMDIMEYHRSMKISR